MSWHSGDNGIWKLTDEEKISLGLKKPAPLKGTIQIVIPLHYGTKGVWWQSRFVTEAEMEGYLAQYPNLQILDEDIRKKYKPEPWDDDEDDDDDERWEFYR